MCCNTLVAICLLGLKLHFVLEMINCSNLVVFFFEACSSEAGVCEDWGVAAILSGNNDCTLSFPTIEFNLKYFPGLKLFINVSLIWGSKVVAARWIAESRR